MIHIEPYGGLCNRMRVLESAVSLADTLGRKVHLIWCNNKELTCQFDRLFRPIEHVVKVTNINLGRFSWHRPCLRPRYLRLWVDTITKCSARLLEPDLERLWRCHAGDLPLSPPESSRRGWLLDTLCDNLNGDTLPLCRQGSLLIAEPLRSFSDIYIASCRRFAVPTGDLMSIFSPCPALEQRIDGLPVDRSVVGVHIRRTDLVDGIRDSPTAAFIRHMQDELNRNSAVSFFLCTDSPEVEEQLRHHFGTRIQSSPKRALLRERPQAIEDAVVDLFALSRCGRILGTRHSSFSSTAAQIDGSELILVG